MEWMKYKKIYFAISGVLIVISAFALFAWGLNLGVDFTGGSVIEYDFGREFSTEELGDKVQNTEQELVSVQKTSEGTYLFKLGFVDTKGRQEIKDALSEISEVDELRFETVGPAVGTELVKKTLYAILIAAIAILIWIAYQFRSIKFGAAAILAMLHDSFILLGSLAVLGHFFSAQVDFLFVTAVLTTLSFSVHDTIVVFDRIRENQKTTSSVYKLANRAITETMVRSLNNSFTIIFMLCALVLLGGTSIRWFAVALLVGTILGTYSSPFVAVPLLTTFDDWGKKLRTKEIKRPKFNLGITKK